jgi:hypothetical protein
MGCLRGITACERKSCRPSAGAAQLIQDLAVLAQVTYLQKDCKNSGIWADKAIAAARKAGEAPKENLFQFKLQCAADAGDNAAMAAVLIDLIKLTNKTNYWNTLLRIERQDERDDHNLLMIYRYRRLSPRRRRFPSTKSSGPTATFSTRIAPMLPAPLGNRNPSLAQS